MGPIKWIRDPGKRRERKKAMARERQRRWYARKKKEQEEAHGRQVTDSSAEEEGGEEDVSLGEPVVDLPQPPYAQDWRQAVQDLEGGDQAEVPPDVAQDPPHAENSQETNGEPMRIPSLEPADDHVQQPVQPDPHEHDPPGGEDDGADQEAMDPRQDLVNAVASIRAKCRMSDNAVEMMVKTLFSRADTITRLLSEKQITASYKNCIKPMALQNIPKLWCAALVEHGEPGGKPSITRHDGMESLPLKYVCPPIDSTYR